MAKWLYIPVEVKVRELHGKLLLAKHAAQNGYNVVIGRKAELLDSLFFMPSGIFFGMWVPVNFSSLYRRLKQRGYATTGLDEEGLVTFSDEIYAKFRLSSDTLKYVDHFFSWGHHHADIVKRYTSTNTPILTTGNLRFDILRPEFRGALTPDIYQIKEQYGQILLIVSSFAFSNHYMGAENYLMSQKECRVIQSQEDEAFFREYMDLQAKNFAGFLKLVPKLAETYPSHSIVIRPHPAEDLSCWENVCKEYENIFIVRDGNIHAWLLASDCIVHHFCTTALEAVAAQVPAIAFRSAKKPEIETDLPYSGSIEVNTVSEALLKVKEIIEGHTKQVHDKRVKNHTQLKNHINNLDEHLCVDLMLNKLDELIIKGHPLDIVKLYSFKTLLKIRRTLKQLKHNLLRQQPSSYLDHKFETLTEEEINEFFDLLPGKRSLVISKLNNMCFLVRQNAEDS